MPGYQGRFRLARPESPSSAAPCRFEFDEQNLTVIPERGSALSMDLADLDWLRAADYEIRAGLYSGEELVLSHIGKVFTQCSEELRAAWTDRLVKALLLADLKLLDTFRGCVRGDGAAGDQPAEIRIFEGGVAVLPDQAAPFHIRLADVDAIEFDAAAWDVRVATHRGVVAFGRLAKRTDLFRKTLEEAVAQLRRLSAEALRQVFPFLAPAAGQQLGAAWREGRVISRGDLDRIDARLWPAIEESAVGEAHRPYADHLASLCAPDLISVSFKRIRPELEQDAEESLETQESTNEELPMIFAFFYPLARADSKLVAQEVTSTGGRATYFFRASDLEALNEALALLNFRRQPIYLPEAEMFGNPRYRHYAAALRRIPKLRAIRGQFAGRAIHHSLESWKEQVDEILRPQ